MRARRARLCSNNIAFAYGYSWTFGRWEERRHEKTQEFLINLLLALPFALAGAFWTLWATGTDFDQPAAVGLLLLIGTVVANGIVMLAHVNHYRNEGLPRHEAVVRGCRERLRPVMMTALTTLISLVPMVVQKPSLGGVYYYSMALVIMGGLLLSTVLTLLLLPTAVTLMEDVTNWLARRASRLFGLLHLRRRREVLLPD